MKTALIIAFIGNAIDAISTLVLYQQYGFYEVNSIMRYLLVYPVLFLLVKFGVMAGLVYYLWRKRTDHHAITFAVIAAVIYGVLTVYHCTLWLWLTM